MMLLRFVAAVAASFFVLGDIIIINHHLFSAKAKHTDTWYCSYLANEWAE
jgi:hypothetical protein